MSRVTIVAECGVNWEGDLRLAKQMIREAKQAGADAVKFQLFDERVISASPYRQRLERMILGEKECLELKKFAESVSVE